MNSYKLIDSGKRDPYVSIAMLTYNHGDFIEEAIESVLNQKVSFPIKLIIADDYSTDNTREILLSYQSKHPNKFKLIFQDKNVGASENNFTLLQNLEGKYVAALEGDDYWCDNDKLQKQVDFLDSNITFGGNYHETYVTSPEDSQQLQELNKWKNVDHKTIDIEDILLNKYCLFHTSSFVFRRKFLILPEWIKEVKSADLVLFLVIADKGRLGKVDGVMSVYRKHESGETNNEYHKAGLNSNRIQLLTKIDAFFEFKYSDIISRTVQAFKLDQPINPPIKYKLKHLISRLF